jgi:hypothetical protein
MQLAGNQPAAPDGGAVSHGRTQGGGERWGEGEGEEGRKQGKIVAHVGKMQQK